jgi:hypothetical protein
MNLSRILSRQRPPVSKWTVMLTALFLANMVSDLNQINRQSNPWQFVFVASLLAAFVLLWPPLAIARCVDLGITPYWIVPIAASYLVAIAAVLKGGNTVAWAAGAIAVLAQVPFVFLSPPPSNATKEEQTTNETGS